MGKMKLYCKVAGQDLHARKCNSHASCRNMFHIEYSKIYSTTEEKGEVKDYDPFASAHSPALQKTVDDIKKKVVKDEIIKMGEFLSIYLQTLEKEGLANDKYRSENLKTKPQKHEILTKFRFAKVIPGDRGCIPYNLVFSADVAVKDAGSRV